MARKFLYLIVVLIVLVIAGAFAYRFFGNDLIRAALVPGEAFRAQPSVQSRAYDDRGMWLARPDLPGNPALWTPAGYAPREPGPDSELPRRAAPARVPQSSSSTRRRTSAATIGTRR